MRLFPQIPNSPLLIAVGILASAIEIYGFVTDRKSIESSPQTNIAGGVQGSVLSGQFNGPVAAGDGAEAVDLRGLTGTIYKPCGPVEQHIGDKITKVIQQEKLPAPTAPSPPLDFTGREGELGRVLKAFDSGAAITGLRGSGGIGKTALALVLADRLKGRFPDGQVFLKLEGTSRDPLKPYDAMGQVVRAFRGSDERLPEGQDELGNLYRSVLDGKRVLLLLDNAFDDKQVLPLLPPKGCAILVTSRKSFTLPGMPEQFVLGTLKPEEADELLLKICLRIGSRAGELAGLCSHLPLALRAAASFLAVQSDRSPAEYLEELRSERTRLKHIGKEGVELDVESSIGLSYGRLKPDEARVFCQLSVFPSDFDSAAEEAVCLDEGHRHLSELVRWSLVEYQLAGDEGGGRYHLHDLVRIFASSRLQAGDKIEAEQRHAEHYRDVLSASNKQYKQGDENVLAALGLFDLEWANIKTGQSWAEKNLKNSPAAASLSSSYPNTGANVLELRLHPKDSIRWRNAGLGAAKKLKDKSMQGVHLGNLGNAYAALGDARKAIEYHEKALFIAREIGDRRGEGAWLGNLGLAYFALGDAKKAIRYFEQQLAIAREIMYRRGEGNALWNTSLALDSLSRRAEAMKLAEEALAIYEQIESPYAEQARQKLAEWRG